MACNRETFFTGVAAKFKNGASDSRREGFDAILDEWEANYSARDLAQLAYVLGTAWHESFTTLQPIREGSSPSRNLTDEQSCRAVTRLYEKGLISRDYAVREPNGCSYYGRGYVQLTFADNYKKLGKELGVGDALYDNPDLAMEAPTAAKIICAGMAKGLFRDKHTLDRYLGNEHYDWFNARLIVNGRRPNGEIDAAALISAHAQKFYDILKASETVVLSPPPVPLPDIDKSAPPPLESVPPARKTPAQTEPTKSQRTSPVARGRTIIGVIVVAIAGIIDAVDRFFKHPPSIFPEIATPYGSFSALWIVLAIAVIGLAIILYARFDDRRKKGR